MKADPFREVYEGMQDLFAVVLKAVGQGPQALQGDVGRGHQPMNQPAAQSVAQSRKELSLGEMSEDVYSLVPDEQSSRCDTSQASNEGDVKPFSHLQECSIRPQSVDSHAALRNNEVSGDVGHLGFDVSVGEAHDQVQNERDKTSIQSSSLSQNQNLWIEKKLRELQAVSKELKDLLHLMKAETGTAEEKSRIEKNNMTDSRIDPCNRADPKNVERTLSGSQIEGHSDRKKTKYDGYKMHKNSALCVTEYWASKLQSMCHELQVMCEGVSSVLPSTLEAFLVGGIICPNYARPYLHLAEVTSTLIGFSSKLLSAVGNIMNNISGSNIKEIAHLLFAVKELITIFPLLETACQNLYSEYLHERSPSDCHSDSEESKRWHIQARAKMDTIFHQMDVAYEQLEKAIRKMNIICDNEAASSEIPLCQLRPETDSKQVDPKEILFITARKVLLIGKHISSLMEVRKFQGQAE